MPDAFSTAAGAVASSGSPPAATASGRRHWRPLRIPVGRPRDAPAPSRTGRSAHLREATHLLSGARDARLAEFVRLLHGFDLEQASDVHRYPAAYGRPPCRHRVGRTGTGCLARPGWWAPAIRAGRLPSACAVGFRAGAAWPLPQPPTVTARQAPGGSRSASARPGCASRASRARSPGGGRRSSC